MISKATVLVPSVAAVVIAAAGCTQPPVPLEVAAPGTAFALISVNLVPMDRDEVVLDQTIVVQDGRVTALGARGEVDIPDAAVRIDGGGRWVMPGLFDLHVHQEAADELLFYLANGVTTILHLSGAPEKLELRTALAAGEVVGPRLFTCGPTLHGTRTDAASVAGVIREIADAGYDCVKIYNDWTPEAYEIASGTAAEVGIAFMGHAPRNLPFSTVLDDGRQQIVHLEEIVYTTAALDEWLTRFREGEVPGPEDDPRVALAEAVDEVAVQLVERGLWVVPTEIVIDNYLERATDEGLAALAARPYLRFRDPVGRRRWARAEQRQNRVRFEQQVALQHYMLEVFRQRGVRLAAGTDAAVGSSLSVMPGWSLHEELAIMVSVGFTSYEALRMATVDAAAYLDDNDGGVIRQGGRADLLVLDADPLAEVSAAARPVAVVAAGRWLSRVELDRELERVAESFLDLETEVAKLDDVLASGTPGEWIDVLRGLDEPSEEIAAFVESEINRRGYELLGSESLDEAIEVLDLNNRSFPDSANTYDSLAEAWLTKGDRQRAVDLYRRALEVDPDFRNAAQMLERLGVEP